MFNSPEQAEGFFASVAFYNRHVGEFVVAAAHYFNLIDSLVRSF